MEDTRPAITCWNCRLRQFSTKDSFCRRCHRPLPVTDNEMLRTVLGEKPRWVRADHRAMLLGKRLRQLRISRGMSQCQMGRVMGHSTQFISKVERGLHMPTLSTLQIFAQTLKVTTYDILRIIAPGYRPVLPDPFLSELRPLIPSLAENDREIIKIAAKQMSQGQYTFNDWIAV